MVLDSGPIIKNEPVVSSLLGQSEVLITVSSVIAEIRDVTARSRIEVSLLPFLQLREPKPESMKTIIEFARRTGDLEVLSKTDLQVLALAYELECERNGGDWRLRRVPGQKRMNGPPPEKTDLAQESGTNENGTALEEELAATSLEEDGKEIQDRKGSSSENPVQSVDSPSATETLERCSAPRDGFELLSEPGEKTNHQTVTSNSIELQDPLSSSSDSSDSEGWITPSNIKKHQLQEQASSIRSSQASQKVMQVATLTTDFAMQNVLMQMNLNLLSTSLQRVRHLKTFILRCHACFAQTKDMKKQFCARCGKPTLMRVSCSTLDNGEFKIHLKKNMQWNTRGDRYSIPKPVNGSANGKVNVGGGGKGGGKGGWGQGLILTEDQKEYTRAMREKEKVRTRDLMDEDYLPGILTGERGRAGGRVRVGAGRNVNSRKWK